MSRHVLSTSSLVALLLATSPAAFSQEEEVEQQAREDKIAQVQELRAEYEKQLNDLKTREAEMRKNMDVLSDELTRLRQSQARVRYYGAVNLAQETQRLEDRRNYLKALDAYREFSASEPVSPYWIGVHCQPADEVAIRSSNDGEEFGFEVEVFTRGLKVESVTADGAAQAAGLKAGDFIITAGSKSTRAIADLVAATSESKGKAMPVRVVRNGRVVEMEITPRKREQVVAGQPTVTSETTDAWRQAIGYWSYNNASSKFPDGLEIQFRKKGSDPVSMQVKYNDKSWNISGDKVPDMPVEVAGWVNRLIKATKPKNAWQQSDYYQYFQNVPQPATPDEPTGLGDVRRELLQLKQAIRKLQEAQQKADDNGEE